MKPQKTVAKMLFSFYVYQEKCPNTQGYKLAYTEYLSQTRRRSENLPKIAHFNLYHVTDVSKRSYRNANTEGFHQQTRTLELLTK